MAKSSKWPAKISSSQGRRKRRIERIQLSANKEVCWQYGKLGGPQVSYFKYVGSSLYLSAYSNFNEKTFPNERE